MKSPITGLPFSAASCRYRIESGRKLQIEEYSGRVGLDDLKEMAAAVAADPASSGDHNRLMDLSGAALDLSSDEILRFALLMRSEIHRSFGWHAFAVGDSSTYSLVRMFSHWARVSERSGIFESRAEAERWLDLHSPQRAEKFVA